MTKVGIVGAGFTGARTHTSELSWKELMYRSAVKAYEDAGVDPREEVDSFVTAAEDYWEGFSIFDEFVPDQLGAMQRSVCTVTQDGLNGLCHAWMQIRTGLFDVVAVECHSKASDMETFESINQHGYDPVYNRPLDLHPFTPAGIDMSATIQNGVTADEVDQVAARNRRRAIDNPHAAWEAAVDADDVASSPLWFDPVRRLHVAGLADGSITLVLAAEETARQLRDDPVWLSGVGWSSGTPWLENHPWGTAPYAEASAREAFDDADVDTSDVDVAEVDDRFAHKQPQHVEALGLDLDAERVNPSGGSQGVGNLLEANGLRAAYDVVTQLRGEAGRIQVDGAEVGVAQSWRGPPTASGAVAVMEGDR